MEYLFVFWLCILTGVAFIGACIYLVGSLFDLGGYHIPLSAALSAGLLLTSVSSGLRANELQCSSYADLSGFPHSYSPSHGCLYETAGGLWVSKSVISKKHLTLNPEL